MQGRLVVAVVVIAAAYVLALAGLAFAAGETQVVTHDNQKDWKIDVFNGTVTFDPQPADCTNTPPAGGAGALHLTVDPGDGWARLRNGRFDNAPLASLTKLDYWTCDRTNNGQQWPFILLDVDWDGNHTVDDFIFFEPAYQNPAEGGLCGIQSAQGPEMLHQWQEWDALRGTSGATANACWWSANDPAFPPGFTIRSLKEYVAAHPAATIVNPDGNHGGVQIVHGFASPSDRFDGYADLFRIGARNPNFDVTFDFEQ